MKGYLAVVLLGIVIPSVASSAEQASTDQPTKPVTQAQGAAGDDCDRLIATLELRTRIFGAGNRGEFGHDQSSG